MHIYLPQSDHAGFGFFSSRNFRAHYPQIAEILEEWYDRSADNCDLFINISEIDKYSVTCTVCRYFDVGCDSTDLKGPSIVKLLDAAKQHDSSY
ncbi:MAG: hypothetical protein A2Z75_02475 [Chloroflexi bacterium RBG_13_50_10]|jgi:hypothetical protein|nr:MAG: hypothetical protein A2Z75_02475 [Chloroflexi bacterium RBG_13_50_10]